MSWGQVWGLVRAPLTFCFADGTLQVDGRTGRNRDPAREGETEAFGILVRRFQDMAVGYGYSILHDFQLAEDAAQEAFFEAHRSPSCVSGVRRLVPAHRLQAVRPHHRRRVVATVPLDSNAGGVRRLGAVAWREGGSRTDDEEGRPRCSTLCISCPSTNVRR